MNRKISNAQEPTQKKQPEPNEISDLEGISVHEPDRSVIENKENEKIILEHLEQNLFEVSYTCLLLPRFNTHYLMDDVVDCVQKVVKQISISYGWPLGFVSINPDYMQWAMYVHPSTSTTQLMNIVRTQTSMQIFDEFPRFKHENLSADFWAPGYLIYWGSQPHPVEIIQQFIRQTRKQQGIPMNK